MNRVRFLIRKEFIQIIRDWRTLVLTLFLPVGVLLLFGYAITLDVKELPMAVVDHSGTRESRDFVRAFSGSGYFVVMPEDMAGAELALERRQAKLAMVIPPDFALNLGRGEPARVQLLIDGSESNTSTIALGYAQGIIQDYAMARSVEPAIQAGIIPRTGFPPVELRTRARFNPELSSTTFIVPGLVALIMMMTIVVLTSLSVVKERELGTLETIMVSPLKGRELIIGKLAPYFLIGFADLIIILSSARLLFGVPFRGSALTLAILSALFITGGLGMGLFISTIVDTQRTAWMVSLLSTMLPSFILSGFVFPIRVMPHWLQLVTYIVPVRYYLVIVRGIVLKGSGFADLVPETMALLIFSTAMITLSVKRFSKTLA